MQPVFRFADWTLDVDRGSLSNDGVAIELRPKAFALLHYLVSNPGRLLGKDELLGAVWPRVIVTEDSLVRCVHELRQALGDKHSHWIKTMPRRGYRFDAEVRVEDAASAAPGAFPRPDEDGRRQTPDWLRRVPTWTFLTLLVLTAATLLAIGFHSRLVADRRTADPPRIAVLPFHNLTGDARQDYFSEGMTEDLTTRLSYFPELAVIARNSAAVFGRSPLSAGEIGKALDAKYLLEGSVRRDRGRLRIMAQLVEAETGEELWARRYDRSSLDVFAVQDDVTQEIAATLAPRVRADYAKRGEDRPASILGAYDLVLRAREVALRTPSPESTREARELAERALRLDPNFAAAHVQLGRAHYRAYALEWDGQNALAAAEVAAKRAVALDPASADASELLGRVYLRRGDHQQAIRILEQAVDLNPNMAEGYASLADALTFAGRAAEAIPLLEKSIRLDPFHLPQIDMYLGRALYFEGDLEAARRSGTAQSSAVRP